MSSPLDHLSSEIIRSSMMQKKEKSEDNAELQNQIKASITDLKEEIEIYSEGFKNPAIKQAGKKSAGSTSEILDEHLEKLVEKHEEVKDQKIDSEQKSEFLTKDLKKEGKPVEEEMSSAVAALLEEDNVKKKKKVGEGKSKLEEKIEYLSTLENDFKNLDLKPEDKELVEQFFDRLSRIKNLKNRLKQLEFLEAKYEDEQNAKDKLQNTANINVKEERGGFLPPFFRKK